MVSEIVNAYVAGFTTPAKIVKEVLRLTPGTDEFVQAMEEIRKVIEDPGFQRNVARAKADVVSSVVESYKASAHRYKLKMDQLAFRSKDDRVSFQACKDGLDRAGTAPTQKMVYFSPEDYRKALEDALGPPEGEPEPEGSGAVSFDDDEDDKASLPEDEDAYTEVTV